jgi:hypothetical protein
MLGPWLDGFRQNVAYLGLPSPVLFPPRIRTSVPHHPTGIEVRLWSHDQ